MKRNGSGRKTKFSKVLLLSMALTTGLNMSNASAQQNIKPGGPNGQGNGNGHLVPGPGSGGNGGQTTPQQPPKILVENKEMEMMVALAAREFMQDVLNTYMPYYNARYNLRRGLIDQRKEMGSLEGQSVDYEIGLSKGKIDGVEPGKQRGINDSKTWSEQMILNDIGLEIDQAIANNGKVKFVKNARDAENYQVTGVITSSNASVAQRVKSDKDLLRNLDLAVRVSNETFLQRQIRSELIGDISNIMDSEMVDLPAKLRKPSWGQWQVFDLWLNGEFEKQNGPFDDNHSEAKEFYKKIGNPQIFEKPTENREKFRNGFIYALENGLNGVGGGHLKPGFGGHGGLHGGGVMNIPSLEKVWHHEMKNDDITIYNLGEDAYKTHAKAYMYQRGYNAGYESTYRLNAETKVKENHKKDYTAQYPAVEQRIRTSTVITNVNAEIVASGGKTEFGAGDFFDIVVYGAANRGMKAGTVQAEVRPTNNVTILQPAKSFPLDGFRKLQQPIQYQYMAQIQDQTSPQQDVSIAISVGGVSFNKTVRLTFEGLLINAAKADNPGWTSHLILNKAIPWMKAEWDDSSGAKDQWENKNAGKLFIKLYNLFKSGKLTEAEMNRIRVHGEAIRHSFGEKYDSLFKKDDWKAVRGMSNEIGLAGKMLGED